MCGIWTDSSGICKDTWVGKLGKDKTSYYAYDKGLGLWSGSLEKKAPLKTGGASYVIEIEKKMSLYKTKNKQTKRNPLLSP